MRHSKRQFNDAFEASWDL